MLIFFAVLLVIGGRGLAATCPSADLPFQNNLMPEPASLTQSAGGVCVSPSLSVGFSGVHDVVLEQAASRMRMQLEALTDIRLDAAFATDAAAATVEIHADHPAEAVQSRDEDESYTLRVQSGHILINAPNDLGAMHGLQTLLQLVQREPEGYVIPDVNISDSPRFQWRGLMIDCGRHFEPVPVILRTLDGMAAVKLNVFHWHLSDDQGFRMESLRFPKLQELGSNGQYYTQQQAREVVAYAHARGIRVVPEFDMPGHTTSWFVGYPELASGPGPYTIPQRFGVHDPTMDPTRESTYQFLDGFVGEMAALFPDAYMHIGGDENNGKQWKSNPRIQAFMRSHHIADTAALQVYFNQRLLQILTKYHKRMIGWDEIFTPGLPKDVVIQSWRGTESLDRAAQQGYAGILSAPYYLDGMQSSAKHYLADPIPANSGLTPDQKKLVLGGEICMWAEQISPETIDSRIWPRAAAIAERFWSPANVRNVDDMYRRLWVTSLRLDALGLKQISGPQRMQRQLAGKVSSPEFDALTSVLEPVSFGERYDLQHTDAGTPLNGLVDAVVPDPPSRHNFALAVRELLADRPTYRRNQAELDATFRSWRQTSPKLHILMQSTPQLNAYFPLAGDLARLGEIGTEALDYLNEPAERPQGWQKKELDKITAMEQQKSLVRLTVLAPMKQLVAAAGTAGSPDSQAQSPAGSAAQ